jgi:hypothetical protein
MRVALEVEFNYLRVYFNSLAIDALDRNGHKDAVARHPSNGDFVAEIAGGAQDILLNVINDLLPDGKLQFIPVRIYFRILVAALSLFKVCESILPHS